MGGWEEGDLITLYTISSACLHQKPHKVPEKKYSINQRRHTLHENLTQILRIFHISLDDEDDDERKKEQEKRKSLNLK